MRRYRKGQTYRPPTAAESAANADAVEAFRHRPAQPQSPLPRGGDIVKTPSDGIDARSGTTVYSATCTRCVESSDADEKTITETDEELLVFNLDAVAVPGGIYVRTGLTLGGMHCVDRGPGLAVRWGKLDANLSTGSSATVSLWEGTSGEWNAWDQDSGDNVTAYASPCFSDTVDSGSFVMLINQDGKWIVVDYYC